MTGKILIAGAGPGDPAARTVGLIEALQSANVIIVRTAIHPGIADIVNLPGVITCDDLYEIGENFTGVYAAITRRVIEAAALSDVLYIVPGHPLFGERTVSMILERAKGLALAVEIVPAVSALDALAISLNVDFLAENVQIIDALELEAWVEAEPFSGRAIDLSTQRPILITQVHHQRVASAVKLLLARLLPEDHQVAIVTAAGVSGEELINWLPLSELDHARVDHLTSVWIPAIAELDQHRTPAVLARIVAHLRGETGCPWDREQDHDSLRNAVLEEAYEVVDAIDRADAAAIAEELGDLLLLVAMHAQIAEEEGDFTLEDVSSAIIAKLVRRHPHVFATAVADTPDAVVATWQGVKARERQAKGETAPRLLFDTVPATMPALMKARKLLPRQPGLAASKATKEKLLADLMLAVEGLVASGYDPEAELNRALRQRVNEVAGGTIDESRT